jgi:hypothetical protein
VLFTETPSRLVERDSVVAIAAAFQASQVYLHLPQGNTKYSDLSPLDNSNMSCVRTWAGCSFNCLLCLERSQPTILIEVLDSLVAVLAAAQVYELRSKR